MTIVKEERYFGPGLPIYGTTSAEEAYKAGLEQARTDAVNALCRTLTGHEPRAWHSYEIARWWPDIERAIAEADEKFDAECSTELLAAVRLPFLSEKPASTPTAGPHMVAAGIDIDEIIEPTEEERRAIFTGRGEPAF